MGNKNVTDKIPTQKDILSTYQKLLSMGFENESACLKAAKQYGSDINACINYLTSILDENENKTNLQQQLQANETIKVIKNEEKSNMYMNYQRDCDGNIKQCQYTQELLQTLINYDKNKDELSSFTSKKLVILNNFIHFLSKHNTNSDDMDWMCSSLPTCDFKKCDAVLRQYRRLNHDDVKQNENDNNIVLKELFDRMHCYFSHCYQVGARLSYQERQKLNLNEAKITNLYKILSNKKKDLDNLVKNNATYNKFCSDLNNFAQTEATQSTTYSFSFRFFYWDYYKNFVIDDHQKKTFEYGPKQLYVEPKYDLFKQELIQNNIAQLTHTEYEQLLLKAMYFMDTDKVKQLSAFTDTYLTDHKTAWTHISNYGIRDGAKIGLQHMLSLIVYTDMDDFQRKFSETFRFKNKTETFKDLKNRHSNFYWMARFLREVIECFGVMAVHGDITTFYHGITNQMQFESVKANINHALSTTVALNVAMQFATDEGIILTLRPSFGLKYFQCNWFSRFSYEQECLYIGGILPMLFVNISNYQNNDDSEQFITALRLIEHFSDGMYFDIDATIPWKQRKYNSWNVKKLKLKPLAEDTKIMVKQLICHELHRNDNSQSQQYPSKLNPYIDNLLHAICSKKEITVSFKLFKVDTLEEVESYGPGYIGYSFLKQIFIGHPVKEKRIINLDLITLLFSNVKRIIICDIYQESNYLNLMLDIMTCFENNGNINLKIFDLVPTQETNDIFSSLYKATLFFEQTFKEMGYNVNYFNEVRFGKMIRIQKI